MAKPPILQSSGIGAVKPVSAARKMPQIKVEVNRMGRFVFHSGGVKEIASGQPRVKTKFREK